MAIADGAVRPGLWAALSAVLAMMVTLGAMGLVALIAVIGSAVVGTVIVATLWRHRVGNFRKAVQGRARSHRRTTAVGRLPKPCDGDHIVAARRPPFSGGRRRKRRLALAKARRSGNARRGGGVSLGRREF